LCVGAAGDIEAALYPLIRTRGILIDKDAGNREAFAESTVFLSNFKNLPEADMKNPHR
jgi:hypothetical protein